VCVWRGGGWGVSYKVSNNLFLIFLMLVCYPFSCLNNTPSYQLLLLFFLIILTNCAEGSILKYPS